MIRGFIRGLGELFLTFGVAVVLFAAYTLWGTGQYTENAQADLGEKLDREWARPEKVTTEKVKLGDGVALIRIPKFGKKHRFVVVEGVGVGDLRKGPGHYPDTAMPGELGNFVVSGHRTTYSAPFNRVGELRAGDKILIDTRDMQYVYKVTGLKVVRPNQVEVTEPVPFHPGRKPKERLITLTTCHPKYSAAQRLIVFGELAEQTPRVTGHTAT
ncbi:class E sortase [Actinocorallia sp. A-T 12471]|uniref:class E sortase n=1 Tax=Actinocorallia sp. A-T 12471 TaxID=3089813 RepID=UPI0029CBB594|nr:class E sortase [Actinocorallia sp. A-T 12471]MDX6742097.1 class E sortase [Actinocorallia sp. A-T 12471]